MFLFQLQMDRWSWPISLFGALKFWAWVHEYLSYCLISALSSFRSRIKPVAHGENWFEAISICLFLGLKKKIHFSWSLDSMIPSFYFILTQGFQEEFSDCCQRTISGRVSNEIKIPLFLGFSLFEHISVSRS